MKTYIIIGLSIIYSISFSQNYNYRAELNKVKQKDYYKIQLTPKITAKLKNNFFDIRIFDNNKQEIPYIFSEEKKITENELFVEYKIISNEYLKKRGYTRIVIQNPDKTQINNIVLKIKNADVRKHLKLNASYDNESWYVLKDNYYYNSINSNDNTYEIRILNFPLSDYEYYELLVGDFFDKPINITNAGYYNTTEENGKYTEIKNIKYEIKDTLKETIIKIATNKNYIDKIYFDIDSPRYYYREVEVFAKRGTKYKKRVSTSEKNIANYILISNSSNTIALNNLQEDTLYIRIKNNDNYVLNIKNIKFYQLNKYIIAELNPEKVYYLQFNNEKAKQPKYDLVHFADKIPSKIKIILPKNIEKISKADNTNTNFNLSNYWLWIVIVLVAILLLYMSVKMVKENK